MSYFGSVPLNPCQHPTLVGPEPNSRVRAPVPVGAGFGAETATKAQHGVPHCDHHYDRQYDRQYDRHSDRHCEHRTDDTHTTPSPRQTHSDPNKARNRSPSRPLG